MYRQIMVHSDDWDLQRILWYDNDQLCTYQLRTVTYGQSCAPFLALRTMEQLVTDHGSEYPLGASTLSKGRYVDDIFGGADTIYECQEVVEQVDKLCMAGCFPLQKWISNNLSTLISISPERYVKDASISIRESTVIRTLGLTWKPASDDFQFQIDVKPLVSITKRNVLSHIAKLFDPLGFVAPVIVQAKIFLQQLWLIKLNWDETLPPCLLKQWQTFENQLQDLPDISIPRFLGLTKSSSCCIELHGFSDASQSEMGAVMYIKVKSELSNAVNIVCAKTKVAPLKKMSIPRLELTAALMLVRLAQYIRKVLNVGSAPLWLWTDSRVTLTWIQNHPSKWKDFVCNRVGIIQEIEPLARWRFVPGKDNPADCASRGLPPRALKTHKLWWSGPSWLAEDSTKWPMSSYEPAKEAVTELRIQKHSHLIQSKSEPDLLCRYSDINKLLRVTSWCKRFINCLKKDSHVRNTSYLTPKEFNDSLLLWTEIVQQEAFNEDLKLLNNRKPVSQSSKLRNFNPFLDQNKLTKVGGRLNQASLEYDTKHPFLLPKDSSLSKLIIIDAHLRTLHSSTSNTLSTIRQRFWILGGRPTVKKELLRCVICARYRAERAQQLMGQLLPSRVTPSRPFIHSGVDYAGPFIIKTWHGREAKTYKGYIVVFICSSTSAIHLELVTDYSSETFIAAYKRFTARRGICSTLTSYCGTTFIGADAELTRLFTAATSESNKLRDLLTNDGTQWKFNPPFGGH